MPRAVIEKKTLLHPEDVSVFSSPWENAIRKISGLLGLDETSFTVPEPAILPLGSPIRNAGARAAILKRLKIKGSHKDKKSLEPLLEQYKVSHPRAVANVQRVDTNVPEGALGVTDSSIGTNPFRERPIQVGVSPGAHATQTLPHELGHVAQAIRVRGGRSRDALDRRGSSMAEFGPDMVGKNQEAIAALRKRGKLNAKSRVQSLRSARIRTALEDAQSMFAIGMPNKSNPAFTLPQLTERQEEILMRMLRAQR